MGNFLLLISPPGLPPQAQRFWDNGLAVAQDAFQQFPAEIVLTDSLRLATFARENGSAPAVARDPATGSCLLVLGTWFHSSGLAVGEEPALLQHYLDVGPDRLASGMDGFFVLVLADGRSHNVIVITDRAGSCHAFVRALATGSCRLAAFSGSSFLLAGLGDFHLDPVACQEFVYTHTVFEDRSFYREIRKLPPATVHRYAGGNLVERYRYWKTADLVPNSLDGAAAVRRLWEALTGAAQTIVRRFPRPVCDLTGGYDSRIVTAAVHSTGASLGTVVSGPPSSADVLIARGLAEKIGLPHLHVPPRPVDFADARQALRFCDGEYELSEYAAIRYVHRQLVDGFDISLNGSFGELARGYWWELLVPHTGARLKLDARRIAQARLAAGSPPPLFHLDVHVDLVSHLAAAIERNNAGLDGTPNTFQLDNVYYGMRMQRWQGRIATSTNRIWPVLSPFNFRPVVEAILQTAPALRKRSLIVRRVLAQFRPDFAQYPLEHGYPAVPVSWNNLYRFRPLLFFYGKKVLERLARRSGLASASAPTPSCSLRLRFWAEDEVKDLLAPASMRIAPLLDPALLQPFLERSRQEGFAGHDQWLRLLTLEYSVRSLEKVGAKPLW